MGWDDFLHYAAGPGIAAIVGVILSVVVEYWPKFGELEAKWKRIVMFLLCLVVPVLASGLGIATASWPMGWEATWWPALVAGFAAFVASQAAHLRKM